MALSQQRLAAAIKQVIQDNPGGDAGVDYYSQNLARVIIAELQQADVIVNQGILVQVAYPAGTGATTSPGKGSIK